MIKLSDVYKEIFSRLKAITYTVDGVDYSYNVYDELPQNPKNPHIRVDYSYNLDRSGNNYEGMTYYQYIHVFSTYNGRKETLEMIDKIVEALSEDIETDDFVAYPYLDRNEIITEPANVSGQMTGYNRNETYRHGILVYKYIIYKK